MSVPLPFALYNPALLPPEALLAEFTARRPMLETVLNIVRNNKPGQPPQHALFVGLRGMGKTTMLWVIAHSINRDPEFSRQWLPVVFDEESRRVGDLADFWLEAIRQWEHATGDSTDRASQLLDKTGPDIEDRARSVFLELVDRSGRRALLLIDNMNDLLASIHDPAPLHRLRAFLMGDSRVMIVGSTTRHFEEITDIDQPFYDFFRVFELHPLSLEETEACLLALAKSRGDDKVPRTLEKRAGTMKGLHLLTGGNPRLIKTFYRLLAEGLRSDIRADLERLLDEFTPYFKAIVDALPVQQQRIFDAVALAWDPVEVGAVARTTRVPSNQVSAQLRALLKAGLVSEAAGQPKRKTYLLADRFSNIHYIMRHGRAARNRFDWFVALVRLIFPDKEQAEALAKVARQTAECGLSGLRDAKDLLHSALCRAESADSRRQLLHATFRESWDKGTLDSLSEWLDLAEAKQHMPEAEIVAFFSQMPKPLRKELGYKPDDSCWWFRLTDFLEEKQAWRLAEAAYRKAIELDTQYAFAWAWLGYLLGRHLGRLTEAEAAHRKAIEIDPNYATGWDLLGNFLAELVSRYTEAEVAYRKAVELDPKSPKHWTDLGYLLTWHTKKHSEAEAAYRKAIELNPKDDYPWACLGTVLEIYLNRYPEAEAAYREAIKLEPNSAFNWSWLGNLLASRLNRFAEAEASYRKAIELDPKDSYAQTGLAQVLVMQGKPETDARAYAVKAVLLDPGTSYCRRVFFELCAKNADDWRAVLPVLAVWCTANPTGSDVFDFTVEGFLCLSRLTKPAEVLTMLDALPNPAPFETLRDAFRAHANREHLNRLAPERRVLAIELLKRLSEPEESDPATKAPSDG